MPPAWWPRCWRWRGLLLVLRAGGAALGWGFQLQEQAVVLGLSVLFVLMACNLAGLFEVGLAATRLAPGRGSAFLNGVLTTVVATPCGAPFASAAFGYALAAPALASLTVFAALGLGLAAPVLVAAAWPGLARRLPRPGEWMAELKQFLAIPMIGAAGWMVWTFTALAGAEAAFVVLVLLLPVLVWLAWSWGRWQAGRPGAGRRTLAAGLATAALAAWILAAPAPAAPGSTLAWRPWSPAEQQRLQAAGTPMLIDGTAAWCLTCQVNKRTTLHDPKVLAEAAARGVVLLRADFTNRDPALAAELARHGRASVPTYLLIDRTGATTVLPDLLTPDLVREALSTITTGDPP